MRLGPILQAIVAVPELAPATRWVESALGLVETGRGRFPRETALTLGSTALVDTPCVTAGLPSAPGLLLLVEDAAAGGPSAVPAAGWSGLHLQRPGTAVSWTGLGLSWTLSDGAAGLMAATLRSAAPAIARGYYRGLGAQSPSSADPWRLPLRDAELAIVETASPSTPAASGVHAAGLRALVLGRGSAAAVLPAPDAHGVGPDGEWLLLRSAPIRPLTD